jgi:predicted AlkP superfamily phosphohydrolase/phosphomutase
MEQDRARHSGARVLVIGLDGATFQVMQPLIDAGKLPNFARLMARGASGVLTSILPPHTGPAWPSMFTGKNLGKVGIFLFDHGDVHNYACYGNLVTSDTVAGRTMFDVVSNHDQRVAAVRVPMTYPAWKLNGVMISGYPATGLTSRYIYPEELRDQFPPMDRVRLKVGGNTAEVLQQRIETEMDATTRFVCTLLERERWDLFMFVYQQPDHAHHYFWRYIDPESPLYTPEDGAKYGHLIDACYERIDAGVGQILEHIDDDTIVFVVSDHGGERTPSINFYTNRWLHSLGLIEARQVKPSLGRRLYELRRLLPSDVRREIQRFVLLYLQSMLGDRVRGYMMNTDQYDWSRTKVYRFPLYYVEGIAINLRGRQPQGIVEPGAEYEQLRDEIIRQLHTLKIPGTDQPLVIETYKREEVYHGPYLEAAPDILFRLAPDYECFSEVGLAGEFFGPVPFSRLERHNGWHNREGVFIAAGPAVRTGASPNNAHLLDVAPTVLHTLGLPIPEDMDGRVLDEIFTTRRQQQREAATVATAPAGAVLSSAEEEDIKERLRSLGYL